MAKKKRVGRKPASAATEIVDQDPDLPSIQEEATDPELAEEFHDTIENLSSELGIEVNEPELNRVAPIPGNWAEEVEQANYQADARDLWSKFKSNQVPTPSTKLNFTEPIKVGDQIVAKLDLEEIEVEASFWKNAIVCFVLGANPPFKVFEGFLKRIWGNLGIEQVVRMNSGGTLVRFRDEATRDLILEAGVIHFDKKPVVLRPWSTDLDSLRMVSSVPVWIRLNGLGLQYWGKKNLSALVSTLGNPIMIDKVTQDRTMVKFARVLVDIEITDDPPKTISYINEKKQLVEQGVEYEWLPSRCSACANLGHILANCNREKKFVWKRKSEAEIGAKKEQEKEVCATGEDAELIVNNEENGSGMMPVVKENARRQEQDKTQANKDWVTPKRKAVRQMEGKAMNENTKGSKSINCFAALQMTREDEIKALDPPTFNDGSQ
ncbi:hypothetical protein CsatB_009516 [Cannabis sativa]